MPEIAGWLERCGGYVAKYWGDGVLVYFGYPASDAAANDDASSWRGSSQDVEDEHAPPTGRPRIPAVYLPTKAAPQRGTFGKLKRSWNEWHDQMAASSRRTIPAPSTMARIFP